MAPNPTDETLQSERARAVQAPSARSDLNFSAVRAASACYVESALADVMTWRARLARGAPRFRYPALGTPSEARRLLTSDLRMGVST
eukprot:4472435-Alexandrium_andersonii.AAC.1